MKSQEGTKDTIIKTKMKSSKDKNYSGYGDNKCENVN